VIPGVPECLQDLVAGYAVERAVLGQAAETYRLVVSQRPTRYLKVAPDLEREHERLRWAEGLIAVPHAVAFGTHEQRDYLLLDELPGTPGAIATDVSVADRVVHVANTLRDLHAMSVSSCPFDARVAMRLILFFRLLDERF
jgi:aminoglycoside 3'-phosphotransferase-2